MATSASVGESAQTSATNPPFQLELYNLNRIRHNIAKADSLMSSLLYELGCALGAQELGTFFEANSSMKDTLTHLCATNITARELLSRIAMVEDQDLRNKLAQSIVPFIAGPSDDDLMKSFTFTFDRDMIASLDNSKGDTNVVDQSLTKEGSPTMLKVYYAKILLRRVNGKYNLNMAYYNFDSKVIQSSLLCTWLKTNKSVKRDLNYAQMLAFNRLHSQLKAAWPDQIQLTDVVAAPED